MCAWHVPSTCVDVTTWSWCGGYRPEAGMTPAAYTPLVDEWKNPNEDWRGVDVSQIRTQLRLSVEDRVRHMVEVANVFMDVRRRVQMVGESEHR